MLFGFTRLRVGTAAYRVWIFALLLTGLTSGAETIENRVGDQDSGIHGPGSNSALLSESGVLD